MDYGDFRFTANELKPNFGFSGSIEPRSGYGRTRPRLTKLRKPKSGFVGRGGDSAYNPFRNEGGRGMGSGVFGWSSGEGSFGGGGERMEEDGGFDGKSSATQLPNEFEKLNVKDESVAGSSGGLFAWSKSSYFEFGSRKNENSHDSSDLSAGVLPDQLRKMNLKDSARDTMGKHNSDSFVFGANKTSGPDGSTEAMLSKKMEHVSIRDGVGGSTSVAVWGSSFHENVKSGTNYGNKENTFFRGTGAKFPTAFNIPTTTSQANDGIRLSSSSDPYSIPSAATSYQQETNLFQETAGSAHMGEGFSFARKLGASTPANIYSNSDRRAKFVVKRHSGKEANSKKNRENMKPDIESHVFQASLGQESVSKVFSSRPESPQSYSPMDMSPYPENNVDNQQSNEAPITVDEFFTLGDNQSSETEIKEDNQPLDEDILYATQRLNIGKMCANDGGTHMDATEGCATDDIGGVPSEESVLETETESFKSAPEDLESNADDTTSASSTNSGSEKTTHFFSVCNDGVASGTTFTFTASTPAQGPGSVRSFRTLNRRKGFDSYRSTATSKASYAGQHLSDLSQNKLKDNLTGSQPKVEMNSSSFVQKEVNPEPCGIPSASAAAQETCEKWRLRGNKAYADGDLKKADDFYTRGVKCISESEKSRDCLRALMLCYSNRAATRMSLGRLREALVDCRLAARIDPSFLKAHVRAANCYLALGEVEEASKYFKICLQSGTGICADRKILTDASEGLHKSQKVAECMSVAIESIHRATFNDAEDALRSADEALAISLYSERLLELKAEALFLLQKYSNVIRLCEESLNSAERNSDVVGAGDQLGNPDNVLLRERHYFRLWRCRLMFKSYFYLGKLEEALALSEKQESLRKGSKTLESLITFVATVRELLHHKAAGNEAFQSGKCMEAIEHYTAALTCNVDSRPFTAICLCNRAAAYKALGNITDAIADCNLSIALESDYLKAISRRASLYEIIRDYGQAARDMERIVCLLKERANATHDTESLEKATSSTIPIDLRQARLQLSRLEEQARKDIPLDMYLIMGIEPSASASEIKKAYRQAALKHHPDKAGQILAKSDGGRYGTWKEIAETIHKDADRLFKLIGEAYTVLSDPAQRSGYDDGEEMRNMLKKSREQPTSRTHYHARNHPFENTGRRDWNYGWRFGRY